MNFDFIFSAWWQLLGSFLFIAALISGIYGLTRNLDDEVEEESTSEFKYWEVKTWK